MPQNKKVVIKPSYIKSKDGKITHAYLDLKTYKAIIARISNFEKKIKKPRSKNK